MQTNLSIPVAAESWFESRELRPWVPKALVVLPLAALRFFTHLCIQWAAALAYYSLIGLVPVLAATFAIIKTLGAGSPEVAREVVSFIDQTQVRAVFVLAALGAMLAVIAIMSNAELCLNHI